ncbi:MAG: hypothetical protein ACREA2_18055 [Blastocatellia bacterium]
MGAFCSDSQRTVAFPPTKSEQKAIIAQVRASTAKLELSVLRAQREIELVRGYRTRLIADVVTGKLDVREAARQLPIEADEPKTLIEAGSLDEGEESFDGDVEMIAADAEDNRE